MFALTKNQTCMILASLPLVSGGLFPVLVMLERRVLTSSTTSMRIAIAVEFVWLIVFLLTVQISGTVGCRAIPRRKFLQTLWAILSIVAGFYLMAFGFDQGAALLYAT